MVNNDGATWRSRRHLDLARDSSRTRSPVKFVGRTSRSRWNLALSLLVIQIITMVTLNNEGNLSTFLIVAENAINFWIDSKTWILATRYPADIWFVTKLFSRVVSILLIYFFCVKKKKEWSKLASQAFLRLF